MIKLNLEIGRLILRITIGKFLLFYGIKNATTDVLFPSKTNLKNL